MPLSKDRMKELSKERHQADKPTTNLNVRPDVQPKCSLPNCIICNPGGYQEWFKRTYGRYDTYNQERFPIGG